MPVCICSFAAATSSRKIPLLTPAITAQFVMVAYVLVFPPPRIHVKIISTDFRASILEVISCFDSDSIVCIKPSI